MAKFILCKKIAFTIFGTTPGFQNFFFFPVCKAINSGQFQFYPHNFNRLKHNGLIYFRLNLMNLLKNNCRKNQNQNMTPPKEGDLLHST